MVQPLRKRRADGSLYQRRAKVDKELERLDQLRLPDVLALARENGKGRNAAVSSEALVYLLRRAARNGAAEGPGVDGLVSVLIDRSETTLRRHISGAFDEVEREVICREVIDRMIDELTDASDKADYAEVNFNDWLAHNRVDACRKQQRKAARVELLGDAVEDLAEDEADIVLAGDGEEPASPDRAPEAAYAVAEAREKADLPQEIADGEFTPADRYRIAAAVRRAELEPRVLEAFILHHYWGVPIDSKDPDRNTLVKHFSKSEKTIRNWLAHAVDAFAKLRGEKNEDERDEASEPRLGAARLSR